MLSKVTLRAVIPSTGSTIAAVSPLPRPMSTATSSAARLAVISALPPNIGMAPRVWAAVAKSIMPPEAPT